MVIGLLLFFNICLCEDNIELTVWRRRVAGALRLDNSCIRFDLCELHDITQ